MSSSLTEQKVVGSEEEVYPCEEELLLVRRLLRYQPI